MAYPQTFILLMTEGGAINASADAIAHANAVKLAWKGIANDQGDSPPNAVTQRRVIGAGRGGLDGPPTDLGLLTGADRLYIVGHGSYGANPTVGGLSPHALVNYLVANGLVAAAVISLVSCNSGWGFGDLLPAAVAQGYFNATQHPFGFLMAGELTTAGIHTEVRARVGYVKVLQNGRKSVEMTEMTFVDRYFLAPKLLGLNKRSWQS